MNLINLKESAETEKTVLEEIFNEAKVYFNQVEGRDPLPPLIDIQTVIPELPSEDCHCLSIYYLETIVGYLWVFDDSPTSFYVLHFYIGENYRNLGLGKLAMRELEKRYSKEQLETAELVVSANNYLGLKFWRAAGFDKLINVYQEEQIGSSAIELELQKQMPSEEVALIHLLPVDERNAFLGADLAVTPKQVKANLVLAIPEAIKAAEGNPLVEPYFICLDNRVIGYTALVFDETIPVAADRYWLWQLAIDQAYQNKGYAGQALALIIGKFRESQVPVITLSTKSDNVQALHLYEQFGFVVTEDLNGRLL